MHDRYQYAKDNKGNQIIPFIAVEAGFAISTVMYCHLQVTWPQRYTHVYTVGQAYENEKYHKHRHKAVGENWFDGVDNI